MRIFGGLASGIASAANFLGSFVPGQPASILQACVGLIASVAITVLGGLFYYLLGSKIDYGQAVVITSTRDWVIFPTFLTLQFAAIVLRTLLQSGLEKLKDRKAKAENLLAVDGKEIITISWSVYGMCLGLSCLLGLMFIMDMYGLRSWLSLTMMVALIGGFAFVHVVYLRTGSHKD